MANVTLPNGTIATVLPYTPISTGPFGLPADFQATATAPEGAVIDVTFSRPVSTFEIEIVGSRTGGYAQAFDVGGRLLQQIALVGQFDAFVRNKLIRFAVQAGTFETSTSYAITRIRVVPARNDYLAYRAMSVTVNPAITNIAPIWRNGLTRLTESGIPPATWEYGADGFWYPPGTVPPRVPTVGGTIPGGTPGIPSAPPQSAPATSITLNVRFNIGRIPQGSTIRLNVRLHMSPRAITLAPAPVDVPFQIYRYPIQIDLKKALKYAVIDKIGTSIEDFFDQGRRGKTVLNFGNNFQSLINGWKYDTNGDMLVKLYRPLPTSIVERSPVFISREIASPVIEQFSIIQLTTPVKQLYLRPANRNINITGTNGRSLQNVTLQTLFTSGAFDPLHTADTSLVQSYSTGLDSTTVNVDYTQFNYFVFYGSAYERVAAFRNKLIRIEALDMFVSGNSASFVSGSASLSYVAMTEYNTERVSIVRSFDGYEKFLYYGPSTVVAESFGSDLQDPVYTATNITYPKISNIPVTVAQASAWFTTRLSVASDYDNQNIDRLANNLPFHVKEDSRSAEFIKFFDMIGHQFDYIKLHIDAMSTLYNRDSNPLVGLNGNVVWSIAKSMGLDIPNEFSKIGIADYTVGNTKYSSYATEIWKRHLHNQVYLYKTKGTKESIKSLLNIYGLSSTVVRVQETSTPSSLATSQSFEVIEETTTALPFSASYVTIPWTSTSHTVQTRFATAITQTNQVLFNLANTWAVKLVPASTTTYTVNVLVGASTIVSSSAFNIGSSNYYTVMTTYDAGGSYLTVQRADEFGDIVESQKIRETGTAWASVWQSPTSLSLGGSGSFFGAQFRGIVDEFRVWSEVATDATFSIFTKYPGAYSGNTHTSANVSLLVRLSFNKPKNLSLSPIILNESPNTTHTQFATTGFTSVAGYPFSMIQTTRVVNRPTFTMGGLQGDSNKIIIAPAPVFQGGSKVLNRTKSILSIADKTARNKKSSNTVGLYFSITNEINDSVIRSIGSINVQDLIGDPRSQFTPSYVDLEGIKSLYWERYASKYDINKFNTFISNLLHGFFIQAAKLVPAKAKLITGTVIEPTILDRNKVASKPVVRDEYGLNLEAFAGKTSPFIPTSTYDNYNSVIIYEDVATPTANIADVLATTRYVIDNAIKATADDQLGFARVLTDTQITSENTSYDATIYPLSSVAVPMGSISDYVAIVNLQTAVFTYSTTQMNIAVASGALSPDQFIVPLYQSISDPENNLSAREFFNNTLGLVGVFEYRQINPRQAISTELGIWVRGTVYTRDAIVTQPDTVVDSAAINGNGKKFYAKNSGFISNTPPYADPYNWQPVQYINTAFPTVKKVVDFSGSITYVNSASAELPFVGYAPDHYKFVKPTYTAFTRARYTGCINSDLTTFDGRPAVEVFLSEGDSLIVANPQAPVQNVTGTFGPILDVI